MEKKNSKHQSLSHVETFHNLFFYFVEALSVMTMDAMAQCKVMSTSNVAWEVQHDVLDAAVALQNWPEVYLSQTEKDDIGVLISAVKALPAAALSGPGEEAMNHSAWMDLRRGAAQLLKQLEHPIQRTREFFQNQ